MSASLSRRVLLRHLTGLAAGGALGTGACRRGDEFGARRIGVHTVGFTLGIQTPAIAAWSELLGEVPGYGPATITRLDRLPVITQSIISGAGDIGDGDILTTLRAISAGADLKIIALSYHSTGLVIVANKGRVPTAADLASEGTVVAINSRGDFTHVLLLKPLQDAGVDPARLNLLEIGGSGDRMRALLAGRVHAVPVHVDQAAELLAQGDFHVLIEPWRVFPSFPCAVLFCRGAWLADPANRPAAVALVAGDRLLYLAATRANQIWRIPLHADGSVFKVNLFLQLQGGLTGPDGLAVDEQGNLVVCHCGLGTVWVFSRTGEPLYRIRSHAGIDTSNAAFGGPDNRTLYVTESESGSILAVPLPVPGRTLFSHA